MKNICKKLNLHVQFCNTIFLSVGNMGIKLCNKLTNHIQNYKGNRFLEGSWNDFSYSNILLSG
jgi:hypothetical protein